MLQPTNNDVLIYAEADPSKTDGGLLLPHEIRELASRGEVVAKGPDVSDEVNIGDVVVYTGERGQTAFIGQVIRIGEDDRYRLIKETDLLAAVVK